MSRLVDPHWSEKRGMRIGAHVWPDHWPEYVADIIAHAVWFSLAISALVFALGRDDISPALLTFAIALTAVVVASTANNLWPLGEVRRWLSRIDRAVIYPLIAATSGAFLAIGGLNRFQFWLLVGVWAVAIFGVVLKLGFPGRLPRTGMAIYLGLGVVAALGMADIAPALGWQGIALLVAGGAIYAGGVRIYLNDHLPYRAAIWHLLCTLAGACHFAAIMMAWTQSNEGLTSWAK